MLYRPFNPKPLQYAWIRTGNYILLVAGGWTHPYDGQTDNEITK